MSKLHTFIWGVRVGFEAKTALYPDRSRLSDPNELQIYNAIVPYFTQDIDLRFRACDRDFYFIIQAAGFYLYSYVDTKHQDYKDRKAYLVYSIAVPLGEQIQGDLNGVLHELKEFYQKKQGSFTVIQNQFTASQIEEITAKLSLSPRRNTTSPKNNIFLSYGNEALPQLGTFHGNKVYFIQQNSNQSLVDALGFRVESLSAVAITNEINRRFAEIVSNRKEADIPEAKSLIASGSALIEPHLQAEFNTWLRAIEENKERHQILNNFNAELSKLKSNPSVSILEAKLLYEQHSYIANSITPEDNRYIKELLEKHREIEKNDKIQLIRQLINTAEKSEWSTDPRVLDQHEPYRSLLTSDLENKIKIWNSSYGRNRAEKLWQKFRQRHEIIKQANNHELKRDLEELKIKVAKLEFAVNTLPLEQLNKFKNNDDYQYLISYKWVPRESKMAPISLIVGIVLVLLAGGYFFLTLDTKQPLAKNQKIIDSDGDGVNDIQDKEFSSWMNPQEEKKYSQAYPKVKWSLKENIDVNGRIDTVKTKLLCDCLKDSLVKPTVLKCKWIVPKKIPPTESNDFREYITKLKNGQEVEMSEIIPLLSASDKQNFTQNNKLTNAKVKYELVQKIYKYNGGENGNYIKVNQPKILIKIFGLPVTVEQGPDEPVPVSPNTKGGSGKVNAGSSNDDDKSNNDDKTIMGFQMENGEPNMDEARKKDKTFFENLEPNTNEAKKLKIQIMINIRNYNE